MIGYMIDKFFGTIHVVAAAPVLTMRSHYVVVVVLAGRGISIMHSYTIAAVDL